MRSAALAAGVDCAPLVVGREGLRAWAFAADGSVTDGAGAPVLNVWKTWAWNTIIEGASDADIDWFASLMDWPPRAKTAAETAPAVPPPTGAVGLHHVLLDRRVRTFEPLWTVLPSSKAILPLLWTVAPGHPYLLRAAAELTPELSAGGYAAKPVRGRAGRDVALHAAGGSLLEQAAVAASPAAAAPAAPASAAAAAEPVVYQELALLPRVGGRSVQLNAWAIHGRYGGTVIRAAADSAIIGASSAAFALRIVPDAEAASAPAE